MDGHTVRMYPVADGSFLHVRVEDADGMCMYAKSHKLTSFGERDYAIQVQAHGGEKLAEPEPRRVHVTLFKPNGRRYTEEDWRIPATVTDYSQSRGEYDREPLGPYDMLQSPDFHRISNGPVLIHADGPWGYEHLFPAPTLQEQIRELVNQAEREIDDDTRNRQLILEDLIRDLRAVVGRAR